VFGRLWRRRRIDEDTQAEVESHIELLTDRYIRAGMSPDDARAAAARQFGNVSWHREEIHMMNGVRLMDELAQDLRSAWRSIRRRPALASAVVVTLALGIGSNTAMFSVVHATLLRPLPYVDSDRVVYVRSRSDQLPGLKTRPPDTRPPDIRDATAAELQRWAPLLTSFDRIEARRWKSVLLTGDEGATRVRMLEVSPGYLESVGSRIVAGRGLHVDDGRPGATPVALISETMWRSRYGARPDMIGRAIEIDSGSRVVVGITTGAASDTPGLRFPVFGPLPTGGAAVKDTPVRGVAWLKPDVSLEAARSELQSVSASLDAEGRPVSGTIERPSNLFWRLGQYRDSQLALMTGVSLLLLIACVNVASLLLGAGQGRAMELALRRALGASRGRVARLLLVESLVLALVSGALGLAVAWSAVQFFLTLEPGIQLQTQLETIRLDGTVVAYTIAIALFTALVCGVMPAVRGSAAQPRTALMEGSGRAATARTAWPRALVAVEVALSLLLLISAGLVARAFLQMRLADPGFAADRVLGVRIALPSDRYQGSERQTAFFEELRTRASRLPGVTAVGLGYGAMPPSDFIDQGVLETEDGQRLADAVVGVSHVSPGYFELMGIPMMAGAGFEPRHLEDRGTPEIPVVISNSLRRRIWGNQDPIGAGFRVTGASRTRRYRVLGVAGDASGSGLSSAACSRCQSHMYVPLPANRQFTEVLLRVADGAPLPAGALRAAIAQIDPGVPSDDGLETAAESLHGFLASSRFRAALFGGFAGLAVTLVAFGLLAVVFHAVKQRTREIGVRMALGAGPSQVRRQIVAQGLWPVMAGMAAGLLAALIVTRTLVSFLLGISPTDPLVFIGSPALLALVAVVAILGPVLQATRVNPVDVLRSE
jgi:predicted permease